MTKLTYEVKGKEYTTYAEAVAAADRASEIKKIYTPINDMLTSPVNPEERNKRIEALRRKRTAAGA